MPSNKNKSTPSQAGFTRIELLVVIVTLSLLALVVMPSLAKSREGGQEAVCMNHMRQLGLALMSYSDENNDTVAEEGNTTAPINDVGPGNLEAWYNVAVRPYSPRLVDLYQKTPTTPPLPQDGSIFSCPSCPGPQTAAIPYANPPNITRAFFMYGMNGRICINRTTRNALGVSNTKLSSIPQPRNTIYMAEVDPNSPNTTSPSQSIVTAQYAVGRHQGAGFFTMADGHVRSAKTNEFLQSAGESNSSSIEWATPRTMYWYPTPTTPN